MTHTDAAQTSCEPFHFGEANGELLGIYHAPPVDRQRGSALLLCYPFGKEYICSHRSFRQLAVRASNAGFPVLRFDYYGCGDSMGRREDGSVRRWLNDVSTSLAEVRRRGNVSSVCVVGLRFGATLAMLAAAEREDLAGLILWDPILDGRAYLEELAAEQRRNAASAVTRSNTGNVTEALGFPLTPELATSIGCVSLASVSGRLAPHILIVDSSRTRRDTGISDALARLGARVDTRHLPGPPVWTEEQIALIPNAILESIMAWNMSHFL
jgi:alpha/beta superfamily hydrolase